MKNAANRLVSLVLALVLVVSLLPAGALATATGDDLTVTKTVNWGKTKEGATDYTKLVVEVISNVPVAATQYPNVLFLGSLCSNHGLTPDIVNNSLNAVAARGNVDYYLYQTNTQKVSGVLPYGKEVGYDSTAPKVTDSHFGKGTHQSLGAFLSQLKTSLNGTKKYDYIVFEFDSGRLAHELSTSLSDAEIKAIATLMKPYYDQNRVIWITDISETSSSKINFYNYGPNRSYISRSTVGTLSDSQFKALAAIISPTQYLDSSIDWSKQTTLTDMTETTVVVKEGVSKTYFVHKGNYTDYETVTQAIINTIHTRLAMTAADTIKYIADDSTVDSVSVSYTTDETITASTAWKTAKNAAVIAKDATTKKTAITWAEEDMDPALKWLKMTIELTDPSMFASIKEGSSTTPGEYKVNPNDGKAKVDATYYKEDGGILTVYESDGEAEADTHCYYYTVDIAATNGTIKQNNVEIPTKDYPNGNTITVDYTPSAGYQLKSVKVDNVDVSITEYPTQYTISDLQKNYKVEAEYEPISSFEVTKVSDPAVTNQNAGDTVTYSVTVNNKNTSVAATNVKIQDVVPSGMTVSATDISDSGTYDATTGIITWNIASIAANSSKTVTYKATIPSTITSETEYENKAYVAEANGREYDGPGDKDDPAKKKIVGVPPTHIVAEKKWSDDWTSHTSDNVYLKVYSGSTAVAGTEKTLTSTTTTAEWDLPTVNATGDTLTYTVYEMTSGAGDAIPVPEGTISTANYKTHYTTEASTGKKIIENNYIIQPKDVPVVKTVSPTIAKAGEELTYTVTVTNDRKNEDASGITIVDEVPAGLTVVSAAKDKGNTPTVSGNTVTWTLDSLAHGETATLTIKAKVPADATNVVYTNTAKMTKLNDTDIPAEDQPKSSAETQVRSYKVTKTWYNNDGTLMADTSKQPSVTVKLMQNGAEYKTATLSYDAAKADNGWSYTFEALPLKDGTGAVYTYTVTEAGGDSYTNIVIPNVTDPASDATSAEVRNTIKGVEISYNFKSGSPAPTGINPPTTETVNYGTAYTAKTQDTITPPADQYTFSGWYTDADCTQKYTDGTVLDKTTAPDGTFKLYGYWEPNATSGLSKDVKIKGETESKANGKVNAGTTVVYTVKIVNNSTDSVLTVDSMEDQVPATLTSIGNISNGGTYSSTTGKITWENLTVPKATDTASGTLVLTYEATIPDTLASETDILNKAYITKANGKTYTGPGSENNNPGQVKVTGVPQTKLTAEKTWSDGWDSHTSDSVYLKVYNEDTPVAGTEKTLTATTKTAEWSLPTLDKDSKTITYTVYEMTSGGADAQRILEGSVSDKHYKTHYTTEASTGKKIIENNYVIQPSDVPVVKMVSPSIAKAGDELTYTITVTNDRAHESATNITIVDEVPAGLSDVSASKDKGNEPTVSGNTVTWTIDSLPAGETAKLTIKAKVPANATNVVYTNTAKMTKLDGTDIPEKDQPKSSAETQVRSVKVTKTWYNADGSAMTDTSKQPSVTVNLLQNGTVHKTETLSYDAAKADNGWSYTFEELPLKDGTGAVYTYTVTEDGGDSYTSTIIPNADTTAVEVKNTIKGIAISYNFKTGSPAPTDINPPTGETVNYGTAYTAKTQDTTTPPADQYTFSGWYTDADCTQKYTDGTVLDKTTAPDGTYKLYGYWEPKAASGVSKDVKVKGQTASAANQEIVAGTTMTYTVTVSNTSTDSALFIDSMEDVVPATLTNITNINPSGVYDATTGKITWTGLTVPKATVTAAGTILLSYDATIVTTLTENTKITNNAYITKANGKDYDGPGGPKDPGKVEITGTPVGNVKIITKLDEAVKDIKDITGDTTLYLTDGTNYYPLTKTEGTPSEWTATNVPYTTGTKTYDIVNGNTGTPTKIDEIAVTAPTNEKTLEWITVEYHFVSDEVSGVPSDVGDQLPAKAFIRKMSQYTAAPTTGIGKTGYTFNGWYNEETAPRTSYTDGTTLSAYKHLYGVWASNSEMGVSKDVTLAGSTDSVANTTVLAGKELTYKVKVDNNHDAASSILEMQDNVPAGLTVVTTSISDGGTYDAATRKITWNNLSIAAKSSLTLTYNVTIDTTFTADTDLLNKAFITKVNGKTYEGPGSENNNPGQVKVTVHPIAEAKVYTKLDNNDKPLGDITGGTTLYLKDEKGNFYPLVQNPEKPNEWKLTVPYGDYTIVPENTALSTEEYGKLTVSATSDSATVYWVSVTYHFVDAPTGVESLLPKTDIILKDTAYNSAPTTGITKPNYAFSGWYTKDDCKTEDYYKDGTVLSDTTNLYGIWSQKMVHVIVVPPEDGPKNPSPSYPDPWDVPKGTAANPPTLTDPDGEYTFVGYYWDPEFREPATPDTLFDNPPLTDENVPTGELKLYPKWTKKPVVTYQFTDKVPEGAVLPDPEIVDPGTPYTPKTVDTVPHYKFEGWYTDEACTKPFVPGTTVDESITLYGKFVYIPPKTGDESNLAMLGAVAACSLAAAAAFILMGKRKESK